MTNRRAKAAVAAAVAITSLAAGPNVLTASADGTGGTPFRLRLSGANEVNASGAPSNPHGDADRGSVELRLNQGQGRVCWTFGAITLTAGEPLPHVSHIHRAPVTRPGPVVVDLFGTSTTPPAPTTYPTGTECVSADRALIKDMRQNPDNYYVNLHNATHGPGVMRAQLSQ